jgi:hypothetical protein
VTDHGISIVAQKDCALLRIVQGDEMCSVSDDNGIISVAEIGNENTADKNTLMDVGDQKVYNSVVAEIESNSQLPEASIANYVNSQPETAKNPRLLIVGARVWSERLDADMYYVVGSFSNHDYAQSLISKHSDLGPAVLVSHLNGEKIYRVAVGPFNIDQRRDVKFSLNKSGITNAWAMHIDHQKWKVASPQGIFNTGKPVALAPEIINPITKIKPSQEQAIGGEVAGIPTPKDKLSMSKGASFSWEFYKI